MMGASSRLRAATLPSFAFILVLKKKTEKRYSTPRVPKMPVKTHKRSVGTLGELKSPKSEYVKVAVLKYYLFNSLFTLTSNSDGFTGLAIKSLAPNSKALRTFSSFPAEEMIITGT